MRAKVKKRKKAKAFPLRPRPLTKERRVTDPFFIHPGDVPAGKAYQWFAQDVPGLSSDDHDTIDRAKANGWKAVPFVRHDFSRRYRAKGSIVVRGMMLMENSAEYVTAGRLKDFDAAQTMFRESPCYPTKLQGAHFRIASDGFIVSSDYARVPPDAPSVPVPVTIQFLVNARWQDAASSLGLTNEEYVRRRLLMTSPVLATEGDGKPYEAVTLQIRKEE